MKLKLETETQKWNLKLKLETETWNLFIYLFADYLSCGKGPCMTIYGNDYARGMIGRQEPMVHK